MIFNKNWHPSVMITKPLVVHGPVSSVHKFFTPSCVKNYITLDTEYSALIHAIYQFQWPRGLRRRSMAARYGRSPAEIVSSNPIGFMDVYLLCDLCVLSGRGLCEELITRPEESYRLWWVVV
jgi:hypothetical protein